jgi:hypothetical protein
MKSLKHIALFIVVLFFSYGAVAHQLSTSYLTLTSDQKNTYLLTGDWQVAVADLDQKLLFDVNQDGNITWQELTFKQQAIVDYMTKNFAITQEQNSCVLSSNSQLQLDYHFNQPYLVIPVSFLCPEQSLIKVRYKGFFDVNASHKAIITINDQGRVYAASDEPKDFDLTKSNKMATAIEYVYQGVLHIWMGLDHILFLVALLLTCVLVRKDDGWKQNPSRKQIIIQTAWIVTAFTFAHSVTLTATAMDLITPDSRWVEVGIALSVLLAALNNVWPVIVKLGWVTFGFGLLHGMGFAGVLGELGLSSEFKLLSVITFNLGVEIGQLAILVVALPLLMTIKNQRWYQKWFVPLGSIGIALIALQWSIQRI